MDCFFNDDVAVFTLSPAKEFTASILTITYAAMSYSLVVQEPPVPPWPNEFFAGIRCFGR